VAVSSILTDNALNAAAEPGNAQGTNSESARWVLSSLAAEHPPTTFP